MFLRLRPFERNRIARIRRTVFETVERIKIRPKERGYLGGVYVPANPERVIPGFRLAGVKPGERILELGHAKAFLTFLLLDLLNARVVGVEMSPHYFRQSMAAKKVLVKEGMLKNAKNIRLIKANFHDISWRDFDYVFYFS